MAMIRPGWMGVGFLLCYAVGMATFFLSVGTLSLEAAKLTGFAIGTAATVAYAVALIWQIDQAQRRLEVQSLKKLAGLAVYRRD